jgi:hypothetical protein
VAGDNAKRTTSRGPAATTLAARAGTTLLMNSNTASSANTRRELKKGRRLMVSKDSLPIAKRVPPPTDHPILHCIGAVPLGVA